MDVQPGHCWRCEKLLPVWRVHCPFCPLAVYCSTSCLVRDRVRHGCVECKIFGRKKCNSCGKTAASMSECSQCNNAWYCDKKCQRRDWPAHKTSCKEVVATIKSLASELAGRWAWGWDHYSVYFGDNMPKDFLQLDRNEWSEGGEGEEVTRDFHILSVKCGDLRNTVLTAASLPDRYQGKLHITLADLHASVLARNVLFLFMLVRFADTDYIASSLTTIWYSLHLSTREYDLIKTSLDELIQMSSQQLHDATKGLVSVLDEHLISLCQVWQGWLSLECRRDQATSINLRKSRKEVLEPSWRKGLQQEYLALFSQDDQKLMADWLDHALFLPNEADEASMEFDNPTLNEEKPDVFSPFYKSTSFPSRAWDYLKVKDHNPGSCSSLMVMYHNYVTNLLQKVKSLILQGRLHVQVFLGFLDFPNHHQTQSMPQYDRIFTSTIADSGFADVLHRYKPLMNAGNRFSVIVTESLNWLSFLPAGDIFSMTPAERAKYAWAFFADVYSMRVTLDTRFNFLNLTEYCKNISQFLQYLRADIMGEECTDVPSFSSVKKYHGMQMRDFRKGLNKLVPFMYRVNARIPIMLTGRERAVEWCLPNSDN